MSSQIPSQIPSRRAVLAVLGASALAPATALAQKAAPSPDTVSVEELMKASALSDVVVGKADAPITIVEYASMTCGHCASFHNKVFPALKEKYIDTGKVRFIMREFPLDNLAAAASMLTRCAGGDKVYPLATVLFQKQEEWAFVRTNPVPELFKIAKQAGFTQESFDKCLTDQKLLDDLIAQRERAGKTFGVNATPAFFINGTRMKAGPSLEGFDTAIAAATKS
ncbi:MAG: DsbA family protein [Hyphomicrobiaceae bacterium]